MTSGLVWTALFQAGQVLREQIQQIDQRNRLMELSLPVLRSCTRTPIKTLRTCNSSGRYRGRRRRFNPISTILGAAERTSERVLVSLSHAMHALSLAPFPFFPPIEASYRVFESFEDYAA